MRRPTPSWSTGQLNTWRTTARPKTVRIRQRRDRRVTALVTTGILQQGRSVKDPLVQKSLKYLETFVRDDGGIHPAESLHKNYDTCLSMLCFIAANQDARYEETIKNADKFVKGMQWTAEEGADESDMAYGGAGYGKHKRPDMSNTQFFIEALRASGNHYNDNAIQRALIFVSRAQNLESPHNTTKFPALVNDGGFFYTPAAGGQSQAGNTPNGGLRSYSSMTYAGLKSMILAGVVKDDPRVIAAFEWVQKHYTLAENPGMQTAGLFYYYHTMAKAMSLMEVDTITDAQGQGTRLARGTGRGIGSPSTT